MDTQAIFFDGQTIQVKDFSVSKRDWFPPPGGGMIPAGKSPFVIDSPDIPKAVIISFIIPCQYASRV
jgi:hypothetical protein